MPPKKKQEGGEETLTRIAIVNADKCKPKKCRQECKKSCPVVKVGECGRLGGAWALPLVQAGRCHTGGLGSTWAGRCRAASAAARGSSGSFEAASRGRG